MCVRLSERSRGERWSCRDSLARATGGRKEGFSMDRALMVNGL